MTLSVLSRNARARGKITRVEFRKSTDRAYKCTGIFVCTFADRVRGYEGRETGGRARDFLQGREADLEELLNPFSPEKI